MINIVSLICRSTQKLDIENQHAHVHDNHSTTVRNGNVTVVPGLRLISADDGSGYCKLNHFPQGRHHSTSSTSSTSPLIPQNSNGVENDSVFGTGAIAGEGQAEMTTVHHNSPAMHPHRHNVGAAQGRPPNFPCQPADYLEIMNTREPQYETIS